MIKFSVIIPTYNDWFRLGKCLSALAEQAIDKDQYEVIVVNNAEKEAIPVDFYLPANAQIIHEPKPGSYIARNTGAEMATGDILAFTDSDCIPSPDWLLQAERAYRNEETDLVAGKVQIFRSNNETNYTYIYEYYTGFSQHQDVLLGKAVTANLFVKKAVFEKAGRFNNKVKFGGDWEFSLRCTEKGYRMIYSDDALVLHPARNFLAILKKQHRLACGGAINAKREYGHSLFRVLGSHLINGLNHQREYHSEPRVSERMIILSFDLLEYFHRAIIYGGFALRLIDPNKARE